MLAPSTVYLILKPHFSEDWMTVQSADKGATIIHTAFIVRCLKPAQHVSMIFGVSRNDTGENLLQQVWLAAQRDHQVAELNERHVWADATLTACFARNIGDRIVNFFLKGLVGRGQNTHALGASLRQLRNS